MQHCVSQEKSKEVLALVVEWGNKLMAKLSLQVLMSPLFALHNNQLPFLTEQSDLIISETVISYDNRFPGISIPALSYSQAQPFSDEPSCSVANIQYSQPPYVHHFHTNTFTIELPEGFPTLFRISRSLRLFNMIGWQPCNAEPSLRIAGFSLARGYEAQENPGQGRPLQRLGWP